MKNSTQGNAIYIIAHAIGLLILLSASSALAQNSVPDPNAWVTDGAVNAIARSADTTYIGGDFTYVGPYTGHGVPMDTTSGAPVSTYLKVNGEVGATVSDGSGGWYIGGGFTQVGGVARKNIAHILSNGSVDAAWNPNPNYCVYALAVSGTTVYAGGMFTNIGGQARNHIAALDASGAATAWNPNASGGSYPDVYALAVSGTTVYAGGWFTYIGGQTRNYIAALDATLNTNNATAWNPNANSYVETLAVSGTTVYVGGEFTNIGGQTRNYIAALDATLNTNNATAWNPNANNAVQALAVSGTTVYAGGWFTSIGGQARIYIAALDATQNTNNATAWAPNADGGGVYTLAVSGTTVYAGGEFTSIGGQTRNYIAALDATLNTNNATAWNPGANSNVWALSVSGTTVYVGGRFTSIGGQTRNHIAALDASGTATAWNPNANKSVKALAVSGTTVYAGGAFTSIGGQVRYRIAALDATQNTNNATAWNAYAGGLVYALAVSGTTVYAGGDFTSIGGQTRINIAALDPSGAATAWNPHANHYVHTLAASGTTLYVGGTFRQIGAAARNYIAALDASGAATAWDPNATGGSPPATYVSALVVSGTTVYAGGNFSNIGGQPRCCLAALDASGAATAWNANVVGFPAGVEALSLSGTKLYVGGGFTNIGGQPRNCLAALDASAAATAWNPFPNGGVYALAVSGTKVYVGGEFTSIGGFPRPYYAQFSFPLSISQQPTGGSRYVGDSYTFTVAASGEYPPLGYQWRHNVTNINDATNTELALGSLALDDAGDYDCIVTDSNENSVTSNTATLTVADHLSITKPPQGATLRRGNPYTLSVETEGGILPLQYQWIKDGSNIPDATASNHEIVSFTESDTGIYTVIIHDSLTDEEISAPPASLNFSMPITSLGGLASLVLTTILLGASRLQKYIHLEKCHSQHDPRGVTR